MILNNIKGVFSLAANGGVQCDHCGKKFTAKKTLKEHLLRVNRAKPRYNQVKSFKPELKPTFLCPDCGIPYSSKQRLQHHVRHVHQKEESDDERRFTCKYCNKKFKTKRVWRYHEMIHTNEQPYLCQSCSRGFKTKEALRTHETLHTNDYNYPCTICDKVFRSRQLLTGHKLLHENVFRHTCHVCGKNIAKILQKSSLKKEDPLFLF